MRVPQRLLLRAGISFSEGCGSSAAGLQLLPSRSAFRWQGGTFVVGNFVREVSCLLSISRLQGGTWMELGASFRAVSSLSLLQTKEGLWTVRVVILTVPARLLSAQGVSSIAFLLLWSDFPSSGGAQILLQSWELFLVANYGGRSELKFEILLIIR